MPENITELTAIGIIFVFFIKEIFSYLKYKKDEPLEANNVDILGELKLMNSNHLNCIERAIVNGNEKIVRAIYENGQKQIEILSRIEGKLK